MSKNIFFAYKGPFLLNEIFKHKKINKKNKITDIKSLAEAQQSDITFLDRSNYAPEAKSTKASFCITTEKLKFFLPKTCEPIIVENVLFELCKVARKFYPSADIDTPDLLLKKPIKSKYPKVRFGNNVFIGKNCKIGKDTVIGSNTVIEHHVEIGKNCVIGSQIVVKNSIIGNNVVIQDGCKLGANCTIDRGSIGDTIIGKNTFLDNQVHVAHNVKIGDNCMIAGQVGFAGSSVLGNNVSIGGQAGISGHLKIGNNVKIGGGSGVVKDIADDTVVMGYPAVPLKKFLKNLKK